MWLVKLALDRPYTFVVMALMILICSAVIVPQTPTDILPAVNVPVISVAWAYNGMNAEELEGRLTTTYERTLTALVDNIEHIESTTLKGEAIFKIFLHPGQSLDRAMAQTVATSQFILKNFPAGTQPPEIIAFSASSVPILQIALSGKDMSEQELNDLAQTALRPQLITVEGAVIPAPYGGKQRQVSINMDLQKLQSKGLAPLDLLNAVASQSVILPVGTAKIGPSEYDVRSNAAPQTIEELGSIPVRQMGTTTIYVRDVATVSDGFAPQTNVVRQDGSRGVLVSVLKSGEASTLDVVDGIRKLLPVVASIAPPKLNIQPLGDQSVFVRSAVEAVIHEGLTAAALTGIMILVFLGSWRSTLIIAISIPLSVLSSLITLSLLHQTINTMTLGGLALAIGILVDDATVEIENINRNLEEGRLLRDAILHGASQIAVPTFVSTLSICIVFLPMFYLGGVVGSLFAPLAEAVVFAVMASYILSRTLVPTLAMYLLPKGGGHAPRGTGFFARFQQGFEHSLDRCRGFYALQLAWLVGHRKVFVTACLLLCPLALLLVPWLGQNFFPETDSGQFILHVRARSGMRIEETARLCDLIETSIRAKIPQAELESVLDNIGLPYSPMNTMHATSGMIGAGDADIFVALKKSHRPTAEYTRLLRSALPHEFPGPLIYFLPADIVSQILNFGIPAPIDIQIEGNDVAASRAAAGEIMADLRKVPGLTDLRLQQPADYPTLEVDVDRTKASQGGYTARDVAQSMVNTLSGSQQVSPMFFLNWKNGVTYNLVLQTPEYNMGSLQDLQTMPVSAAGHAGQGIMANMASIHRGSEMAVVSHNNTRRVVDIYGAVQDSDLGTVGAAVEKIVNAHRAKLPRGSFLHIRGQYSTMHASYVSVLSGLAFAVVLVYLLITINFQSWVDPFIIITALPAALAGIILALFFTRTPLSIPALMGTIMCMGVATANSILVISFAKERLTHHGDAIRAAIEAGSTRFRPVIMTALAMIIGMVPMAIGVGEGSEPNAPLGRAVIGGLLCATIATLTLVPAVFALFHHKRILSSQASPHAQVLDITS
ncbi:MAG: Cation efflux system protein CusA [Verrucomicrobiaceae bacterium]|nr:Cation efflux system protein CusA [Verrucomicrobiaceae bacterium]